MRLHEGVWRELEATGVLAANDPTPLVGRGDELAALRGLLERARDGTGSLVVVSGEPGAGKTRLCREVASEAEALGFAVRFGHCYDSEGARPSAPLLEMFERAVAERGPDQFVEMLGDEAPEIAKVVPELRVRFPDLPPALILPKDQERHFFFNSVRAVLTRASEATPQLMVFEDLHWADEASLAYIDNLASWVGEARLLVIGTYRDVELDVSRPLAATPRELRRRRQAQRIDLPLLGEDGVREMLVERSGQTPPPEFVARVFRETQDNPFFLEEVFQHLFEQGALLDDAGHWRAAADIGEHEVPESIRLVIGERLERVSPECHALLTEVAVMGRRFSYPLIEDLTSLDPAALLDALDEAEAVHLIRDDTSGRDARYEFVRDQIRQTLLTEVTVPRRQRLHLKVADAIEAIGLAHTERALPVAHHLYQAGAFADPSRTTGALLAACAEAPRTGGYEEVVSLANQALEIRQFEGARQEAAVLRFRARAFQSVNQLNEALADFEGALQLLAEAGDTETFAEGCLELAELAIYAGAPASRLVLRLVGQGLEMADERVLVRARLATAATLVCAHAGESPERARARAEEARDLTQASGDRWLAARAGIARSLLANQLNERQRSIGILEEPLEPLRSEGDLWNLSYAWLAKVSNLWLSGAFAAAEQELPEAVRLSDAVGNTAQLSILQWTTTAIRVLREADLPAFLREAEDAARNYGGGVYGLVYSRPSAAVVRLWSGDFAGAEREISLGSPVEASQVFKGLNTGLLPLVLLYGGRRTEASSLLEKDRGDLQSLRPGELWQGDVTRLCSAIEAWSLIGAAEDAAALYEPAAVLADRANIVIHLAHLTHTVAGMAAAAGRQWQRATDHYDTAMQQAAEMPHVPEQPQVRYWYARMLLDRDEHGDREKAREFLTEAIDLYREIGMPKHLELAEELLGGAGPE